MVYDVIQKLYNDIFGTEKMQLRGIFKEDFT